MGLARTLCSMHLDMCVLSSYTQCKGVCVVGSKNRIYIYGLRAHIPKNTAFNSPALNSAQAKFYVSNAGFKSYK